MERVSGHGSPRGDTARPTTADLMAAIVGRESADLEVTTLEALELHDHPSYHRAVGRQAAHGSEVVHLARAMDPADVARARARAGLILADLHGIGYRPGAA